MPLFIQYLIKFSISLALVYLFYQLLLRRLTFYNYNRWYLLGYLLLSFIIPFINIAPLVEKRNSGPIRIIHYIPAFDKYPVPTVNWWNIVLLVLIAGSLCMIVRLCVQVFSLRKMKMSATKINQSNVSVYHVEKSIIPFSFGNNIYINRNMHTEKELDDIVLHEFVHVKQKHTIDILLAEFLCIFNWYNPFAWLLRKAIRQNLEFIADNQVLKAGMDKKNYQYHLLKVIGMPRYSITSNFNFSSLKKRITMMNTMKTAKIQLLRFFFLLPLLAVILLAFRNNTGNQQPKKIISPVVQFADTIPSKEKNVDQISSMNVFTEDSIVKVTVNNGKTETYDLRKPDQKKAFENKYKAILKKQEEEISSLLKEQELSRLKGMEEMAMARQEMQMKLNEQMELIKEQQEKWSNEMESGNDSFSRQFLLDQLMQEKALIQMDSLREAQSPLADIDQLQRNVMEQKLLLELQENNYKNNQQNKTLNKANLKKLQQDVRAQQLQLQRNLEQLKLKESEIQYELKMLEKPVS